MIKRLLIAFATISLAILCIAAAWAVYRQNVRLLQGRTETEWINSLDTATVGLAETERWRSLGPDGVRLLLKALNRGKGPLESLYARFWLKVASFCPGPLSTPVAFRVRPRVCAATLLSQVGPDKTVVPVMVQILKSEENVGVRRMVVGCFDYRTGLLKGMKKEKLELLPTLLRDL